jgi:RNA polymerase sigma-70 factor (ECF subfamily)
MNDFEKLSDEEIIEQVRSNDQELYSIIVDRYQKKLFRYAGSLIKDEEKTVDVVQDSFIKAFINLNGFDIKKKFSSWIYRIVHNEAVNITKKYKKEIPIIDDFDFQSNENIEESFEQKETADKVNKCLGEIPLIYSEPLILFYIEEKSYEEIGDILRMPIRTVATRISRGKMLMKKICQRN